MTSEERADQFRKLKGAIAEKRVIFLAATGTMRTMSERIFDRGELSDGSKLVYNEDYTLYGYKPPLPSKPTGKGKTGKTIKGGFYESYLAMKRQQGGRQDTYFDLTSSLRQDWFGGVTPTPTETGPLTCVIELTDVNAKKADGLARQKGPFFKLSGDEVKEHGERVQRIYRYEVLGER